MKRHPEYKYCINYINKEDFWIFISDKGESGWGENVFDPWSDEIDDGPIEFIERIKERNQWDIEKVGRLQYRFIQDTIGMVFQWDDLFGLVVVVEDRDRLGEVLQFLGEYME